VKIAYVINSFNDGGAELGLLTLLENGFFEGHEVSVCALAKGPGTVRRRLIARLGDDRVRWLSESATVRAVSLPVAAVRIAAHFRTQRPDVAILSLPQANFVGRLASLVVPGMRVVSFEHNTAYNRRVVKYLLRATSPFVDAVFYDHEATWRAIRPLLPGLSPQQAHYLPLTILEPHADLRPFPEGRRRCVTTMRLEPAKNHRELFHAIRAVLDAGHDVQLDVAGEGPLRHELEDLIEELELEDNVHLLGFVLEPATLLNSSDIYVHSGEREGLCRSVLEAMAAGLLVVSTDSGGMKDYGVDGENMIKAAASDRASLASALRRALEMGPEAHRIRERALETIERQFSPAVVRSQWRAALGAITTMTRANATS
jgi:glycosyltransferase involved in cell wall biosynthesis